MSGRSIGAMIEDWRNGKKPELEPPRRSAPVRAAAPTPPPAPVPPPAPKPPPPPTLEQVIAELGTEERAVLLHIARRLRAGQVSYGKLDLANDRRDLDAETGDEIADMLVYCGMAWLKRELAAKQNGRA